MTTEQTIEKVDVPPMDEHNEALVSNVHPPEWVNPEPAPRYNVVAIGAGTAGLVTAAPQNARQAVLGNVAAQSRLADPLKISEHADFALAVAQIESQLALLAVVVVGEVVDETLFGQHSGDFSFDAGRRNVDVAVIGATGIADPGQKIRDWIGHTHGLWSPSGLPTGLCDAGNLPA